MAYHPTGKWFNTEILYWHYDEPAPADIDAMRTAAETGNYDGAFLKKLHRDNKTLQEAVAPYLARGMSLEAVVAQYSQDTGSTFPEYLPGFMAEGPPADPETAETSDKRKRDLLGRIVQDSAF